jgi:hypothetical protein
LCCQSVTARVPLGYGLFRAIAEAKEEDADSF